MNEKAPSLRLSRETVRQLDNDKLVHVGGGACYTTSNVTEDCSPH